MKPFSYLSRMLPSPPAWATHKARFCGIVPCWFADEAGGGCKLQGRGWFADRVMFPVVQFAFSLGAELFGWDVWPITITAHVNERGAA